MEASEFLSKLKPLIKSKKYDLVPTVKNRNSRRKYNLTLYDIEDYIYSFTINDLYKGPELDRNLPGEELFIFKKEILPNVIFYTKLKYKDNQIKIISCHEDE